MTPTNDGMRVWCDVSLIVVVFSIPDRMRDDDDGFVAACEFEFDRLTPRARFLPRYRVFDDATEQAVKTMQTQYGLPMTGTWGALERMMFEEVRIHTDAPCLDALAPAKTASFARAVVAEPAQPVVEALGPRVSGDSVLGTVGSAAAGAAMGLTAALAIGAADKVRRGGSVAEFFADARDNAGALASEIRAPSFNFFKSLTGRGAVEGEDLYEDEYDQEYDDGRHGYDNHGRDWRGDGGGQHRGGVYPDLGPGGSEAYFGYDAQYHTTRTRRLAGAAMPAVANSVAPSTPRQQSSSRRPGGGGARAQRALAGMELQRRQQELVNSPQLEVEAEVAVGASSRPMATMMQKVRRGWDASLDVVGNVIPDRIPLLGNGSDFTARAQRERDLNARLAEARYYAELEQQKRLKAEDAFKKSHQKWLGAQAATREVRAQAAATATKLGELEEKLFSEEIFENHPVVSKVTQLENLLLQETQSDSSSAEELKSGLAKLETNTMARVKELEEQVEQLQSELANKSADAPTDVIARLEALESALETGSNFDAETAAKRSAGLQQGVSDVNDALNELRDGMRGELHRIETELNGIHPLMDHGAGRIELLFAKLGALEDSMSAVSDGAASQMGRLSAQIERLEKALTASTGVEFEPLPEIEDLIEDVVGAAAPVEEFVEEVVVEEEEEEKIEEISEELEFSNMFTTVEEEAVEEEVEETGSMGSAATDFFDMFQETQPVVDAVPMPEIVEPAPMFEEAPVVEPGVLPRIATGREIMLQGFHWESHNFDWYKIVQDRLGDMNTAGFTQVWLPPPADSLAPQGYLPRNLYSLDSAYGSTDSLKNLITNCKEHDVLPVLDAVLNHRCATHQGAGGKWNRWEGTGMDWGEWAIDNRNPDFAGQGGHPTGDEFSGAPNIDHTSARVREDLSKWFKWLKEDIGFGGVRFDFSKGYGGEFAGEYIKAMGPEFAVGEYWDTLSYGAGLEYNQDAHRQRIVDWIDATGGNCTAFDFTTKGILQEACGRSEFWRLIDSKGRAPGVIGLWPARAVTFIDNHDTGSTQSHWPFPSDKVMMGYAYILTHPGTPCVMWDHFFDWGEQMTSNIKTLMRARQTVGIHSRSKLRIVSATDGLYAAIVDDKMAVKLGRDSWEPSGDGWERVCGDHDWTVWKR